MEAKYLRIGHQYKSNGTIQEVINIEKITDKTITFRTNRIYPNPYNGNFFQRKQLNTKIEIVNN